MCFNPRDLRANLPQNNRQTPLDQAWLDYLNFYDCADLIVDYHLEIDKFLTERGETVFQYYQQKGKVLGSCIIVHGYMDHSALYRHLIKHFLGLGWDVLIYDKIGHGLSTGARYAIDSFTQYASQLQQVLECLAERGENLKPWMLIGQSTGAAVVMEHALNPIFKSFAQIKQRVLLAPLVQCYKFNWVKFQYQCMRFLITRVKRGRSENSHDLQYLDFIRTADPFSSQYIQLNWIGAMLSWAKHFTQYAPCAMPVLIIQGSDDQTVNWQYNVAVIAQQFPKSELCIIDGGKHHLVNEAIKWRHQVFAKIANLKVIKE
ncbi:MAG: alpha-beta hydrolase superfamily lysophospholipase [Oceanospirillaceae bacterium]|jgi:alpha-beta hydrolase superfamily lysophospholipase